MAPTSAFKSPCSSMLIDTPSATLLFPSVKAAMFTNCRLCPAADGSASPITDPEENFSTRLAFSTLSKMSLENLTVTKPPESKSL